MRGGERPLPLALALLVIARLVIALLALARLVLALLVTARLVAARLVTARLVTARLVLALLSAASLRFGLRAVVARADFEARDDLLLDFLADQPLDVAKVRAVFARDERHGLAGFARAAGAADAVDVVFRDVRQVVVHHVRQRLDVKTACGDVGGDQDLQLAVLEALQGLHALRLALVAVDRW